MEHKKNLWILLGVVGVVWLAIISTSLVVLLKNKSAKKDVTTIAVEAARLNNGGDYVSAQNLLLEKIKSNTAPELKLALANSYLDEGSVRGKEAEASRKAQEILFELEKSYQSTYLYDLIGYSYEIVDDFGMALGYYQKSLGLDGSSVNTLFSMGHVYWFLGDIAHARVFYGQAERAITNETDRSVQVKVYAGMGVLSESLLDAEKYFLKAIAISDSNAFKAEMYANLASLKLATGDSAGAFKYAKTAIDTDPSNELAHLAFAKSAMADRKILEENWSKVRDSLFKAILLAPRKAESQYWQGKFEFIAGMHDQAIKSYSNALGLLNSDNSLNVTGRRNLRSDINFDIAVAYLSKNDKARAITYAKDAFRDNPVKVAYILQQGEQFRELRVILTVK